MAKGYEEVISEEKTYKNNKHMTRCSKLSVITQMKINTMQYKFLPITLEK